MLPAVISVQIPESNRAVSRGSWIHRLMVLCPFLAVALMPFNDLPWFKGVFREMGVEGSFYPFLIAAVLWVLGGFRFSEWKCPKHISFRIFVCFLAWIIVDALLNFKGISAAQWKGRVGSEKFLLQSLVLGFVFWCGWWSYQTARGLGDHALTKLGRWVWPPFGLCVLYCLVEIPFNYGFPWARNVLLALDPLFHPAHSVAIYGRLRSVSGEPSWFGMAGALWVPWLLIGLFKANDSRWKNYIPLFILSVLAPLIRSKTVYVIWGFQVLAVWLGTIWFWRGKRPWERWAAFPLVVGLGYFLGSFLYQMAYYMVGISQLYDYGLTDLASPSNQGRYSCSYAALQMALARPWTGFGLGQYGFHMSSFLPPWSAGSWEVGVWSSPAVGTAWASAQNLHLRIAAELGFPGLALWLAVWVSLVWGCWRRLLEQSRNGRLDLMGMCLLAAIGGAFLVGFNTDSFRYFGYWILFGFAWAWLEQPESGNAGRRQ